jgi:holin-like protein
MGWRKRAAVAVQVPTQIAGLWLILHAGQWIAAYLPVPVPGNVVGMVLLFVLLSAGLVKQSWLDMGAGVLTRHLAFFFVPIAVGLMQWAPLLREAGHWLLLVLGLSGIVGLAATGAIAQRLGRLRPEERAQWDTSPSSSSPSRSRSSFMQAAAGPS